MMRAKQTKPSVKWLESQFHASPRQRGALPLTGEPAGAAQPSPQNAAAGSPLSQPEEPVTGVKPVKPFPTFARLQPKAKPKMVRTMSHRHAPQ